MGSHMPAQANNLKQIPDHNNLLNTLHEAVKFLPHHSKPFRRRHLLLLAVSALFIIAVVLETAAIIARNSLDPRALLSQSVSDQHPQKRAIVRSSLGFGFVFNEEQFTTTAQSDSTSENINIAELSNNNAINSIVLKPLPSFVLAHEAATELEVKVETDAAAFATFKSSIIEKLDIARITSDYFAPKSSNLANVHEESRTIDTINGANLTKVIYVVEPKFAGNPSRTIVWSTQVEGKPVALYIRGITEGSSVPSSMQPIVQSMQFGTDVQVKGLSVFADQKHVVIDQRYIADLVSPAVVKIYHAICGSLEYMGNKVSDDTCSGKAGSGFLVSGDGYIATNGHVVVYGAKDMLAEALLQNPSLLQNFLAGMNLSDTQIQEVMNRADLTAAAVSKIYDVPDNDLRLFNQREITIVGIGSESYGIKDESQLKRAISRFESTGSLKQASVVGYDYEPKDQLTLVSNPDQGFSASDVALLKIDVKDAPFVPLGNDIRQNQPITLFGFPGDADNRLIDSSRLDVTVTNGTISAVRETSGTGTKLYQTDADASRGNSGGPAVDETGKAFGILTYRYDSGQSGDAAKSYVRDIADFRKLLQTKNITLNTNSDSQGLWAKGLDYYSKGYYSKALSEFERVQRLYPSHRLAKQYVDMSRQAIADGRNVKDPSTLLLVLGGGIGLGGLAASTVFMTRHYGTHRLYKFLQQHKPHLQPSH